MRVRPLAAALWLLLAIFIAAAWWLYFAGHGKLPLLVPLLATALPIAVALYVIAAQRFAAHRGARALEQALADDAAKALDQRPAANAAEIERLRATFDRAVGALKDSRLARDGSGRDALYKLPWYAIIGPPASGKSTVLRNSGLKFPSLPGMGDRLKGVGGTRNCDWWLTNQAILLDTAGRWTTEQDDREEWLAFLDLLRQHRRDQPLNGVIAAISVAGDPETSLAAVELEQVKHLAARVRERLDEITRQLGVSLPVYVMFTKCDLIAGFVETFGDMAARERRQVWGFTAPLLRRSAGSAGEYFAAQLASLQGALEHRALQRMSEEVRPDVVPLIYSFPAQFRALEDKLRLFVDELFEESAYAESPILRGAYFTSGTQEGSPADLLLDDLARVLQVNEPAASGACEKKSYFLYDMLMDVVFEDRDLATASQRELLRRLRVRRAWTAGLFCAAALLTVLPSTAYVRNTALLDRTEVLVAEVASAPPPEPTASAPQRSVALQRLALDIAGYEAGPPSLLAGFGLYQGDDVEPALVSYEGAALRDWIIRPLHRTNARTLITITEQQAALRSQGANADKLDEATGAQLRRSLKLHLLLTKTREACAPKLLAYKDEVIEHLLDLWSQVEPVLGAAGVARRRSLIVRYLEAAALDPALLLPRDQHRTELARAALTQGATIERLLVELTDRFASERQGLARLAGVSTALQASSEVAGAYTRDAWGQVAVEMTSHTGHDRNAESWLLGCGSEADVDRRDARRSHAFLELYAKRYEDQWRRFLHGLATRAPESVIEAETTLAELNARPGVLGTLFLRIKENTELAALPLETKSTAGAIVERALEKVDAGVNTRAVEDPALARLRAAFAGFVRFGVATQPGAETPLEQYRRHTDPLLAALRVYRQDETKLDALQLTAQGARDGVERLLSDHADEWGRPLRELLLHPLEAIFQLALSERGRILQRTWCELVYRPFQEELAGRYPFSPASKSASSLYAFQRFFQANSGIIWSFQSAHLQGFVASAGERYRFGSQQGTEGRKLLRDELLDFLNRAAEVQRAFFPPGSVTVRVPFRVRVRGGPGYSATAFRVGTNTLEYRNGSETWSDLEWPGEQPNLGAALSVVPYQGYAPRPLVLDNEWGLFMILDAEHGKSQLLERHEGQVTLGWRPVGSQHWIKIDFASSDSRSPILHGSFEAPSRRLFPMSIPPQITHSGSQC